MRRMYSRLFASVRMYYTMPSLKRPAHFFFLFFPVASGRRTQTLLPNVDGEWRSELGGGMKIWGSTCLLFSPGTCTKNSMIDYHIYLGNYLIATLHSDAPVSNLRIQQVLFPEYDYTEV